MNDHRSVHTIKISLVVYQTLLSDYCLPLTYVKKEARFVVFGGMVLKFPPAGLNVGSYGQCFVTWGCSIWEF